MLKESWQLQSEPRSTKTQRVRDELLKTDPKDIGEATMNSTWGIGMPLSSPQVLCKDKWTGKNLMGNIIMQICKELDSHSDELNSLMYFVSPEKR